MAWLSGKKRSWIWALKFGVLFAIFLIFFVPVYKQYDVVTAKANALRDQIGNLKKISDNLLTPEELKETQQRLEDFESKLVNASDAGKLLDYISDEADKNHFNVIQIYADSPVTIKDATGKGLELKGKKMKVLPITFRVETDYKSLGNFLKAVKDEIKGNLVIETLSLKKTSPQLENLQCDITLSCVIT